MIRRLVFALDTADCTVPRNLAYLLYSALCDKLPPELAATLHEQKITPLASYILRRADGLQWVVSGFGAPGHEVMKILEHLPELELINLKTAITLNIAEKMDEIYEADFMRRHLVENQAKREYVLNFIAPTSFKSDGEYVIMPSKNLIIKSLAQRWDAESREFKLTDEDAINGIIKHCRITRYRLSSCSYPLKSVNIPAFSGELTLSVRGPEPLLRIVGLLMDFANYSGIGIKTALGMGGVSAL